MGSSFLRIGIIQIFVLAIWSFPFLFFLLRWGIILIILATIVFRLAIVAILLSRSKIRFLFSSSFLGLRLLHFFLTALLIKFFFNLLLFSSLIIPLTEFFPEKNIMRILMPMIFIDTIMNISGWVFLGLGVLKKEHFNTKI